MYVMMLCLHDREVTNDKYTTLIDKKAPWKKK